MKVSSLRGAGLVLAVLAAVAPGCANEQRASGPSSATIVLRCPDPAGAYAPRDLVPIAADVRGLRAPTVEFLVNGTMIARDDKPPFETTWLARDLGTMHVEARARSSSGATARSASTDITVAPLSLVFQELNGDDIGADLKTGKEPSVLLTSPAHGTVFCHPVPIALVAAITPTAAPIARVAFEVDGRPIATLSKPPFSVTWPQPSLGRHAVAVRATDTQGRVAVTPRVLVLVTGRAAPRGVQGLQRSDYRRDTGLTLLGLRGLGGSRSSSFRGTLTKAEPEYELVIPRLPIAALSGLSGIGLKDRKI